jgi:V/A-type H+-transporting ATPase subunit C
MNIMGPFRYAASYAKVHARMGRLISKADWADLLHAANLHEFVQQLRLTHYHDAISQLMSVPGRTEYDIGHLERLLRAKYARESYGLLTFLSGPAREVYIWQWKHFEVENLKTVFRAVKQEVESSRVKESLVPLDDLSKIDWDELSKSSSVQEVVDLLDGSFFGRALQPAMNQYLKQDSLLILETRIDLSYFEHFRTLIETLHGDDRQQAERFLGFYIDSQIILWAYRFRIYYHLSPEEILNYSLQNGIRVTPEILQEIASGADIPVILDKVWGRNLPGLENLTSMSEKEALSSMEHLFSTYLYQQALDVQQGYAMNFGILLGFDTLLNDEVRDLITVAEGKVNHLPLSQITPFLIGDRDEKVTQ